MRRIRHVVARQAISGNSKITTLFCLISTSPTCRGSAFMDEYSDRGGKDYVGEFLQQRDEGQIDHRDAILILWTAKKRRSRDGHGCARMLPSVIGGPAGCLGSVMNRE
jgi:hypothetical protein